MAASPAQVYRANVNAILRQFAAESTSQLAKSMEKFLRSLQRSSSSGRAGVTAINSQLGQEFQHKVVASYSKRIKHKEPYRHKESDSRLRRYAGGHMDRALESPSAMYRVSGNQLYLVDKSAMSKLAPQWYRLNFGAGSAGSGGRAPMGGNWRLGRKTIRFKFSLEGMPPSKAFRVPDGTGAFAVYSQKHSGKNIKVRVSHREGSSSRYMPGMAMYLQGAKDGQTVTNPWSKGIKGMHFFEDGIDWVNKRYPEELNELINTWFRSAQDSLGRRKSFVFKPKVYPASYFK